MNPYTYKPRKAAKPASGPGNTLPVLPPAPIPGEQPGILSSVLSATINPVLALSLVGFLAVFVAGLTAVANQDIIASGGWASSVFAQNSVSRPAVLGLASYGYNQPVCGRNTANCLNHQLVGFYNGGWQVRIDYQLEPDIVGVIRVNGWPFMDNITGSGSGYTGNDLLPGKTYKFILYKKFGNRLIRLTNLNLTAPKAPVPQPVPPPQPPPYGYQTVNVGAIPAQSWREGWIDMLDSSSTVEPGTVTLSGWAFDAGNSVSVNMYLRDANTGRSYRHNNIEVYTTHYRQDVLAYVNDRLGITAGSASGIYYFKVRFIDLPRGSYYIHDARYNNYLFNVHSRAYQPFYISPPPYGYYNPPPPLVLPDLEIRGVRETSTPNLLEITLCMNGTKSINDLKRENANISDYPFNYVVYGRDGLKHERVMNAIGSIEDLKNGQCLGLGTSIQPDDLQYWQETKKVVYIVDPNNYIAESNESNNQGAYQGGVVPQPTQSLGNVSLSSYGLYKGQTYRIKWDSQGLDKVYLKLRKNSVGDTVRAISDTIPNIGYFDWTVPTDLSDAYDYVVRVVGAGTNLYADSAVLGIKAGSTTGSGSSGSGGTTSNTLVNPSYRYLKIYTAESNSWVALREIAVTDSSGNKVSPVGATASTVYSSSAASRALDGDFGTVWNSGSYAGWIIVDLGQAVTLGKVALLPANFPNPANGDHLIYGSSDGVNFTLLTTVVGPFKDNVWLYYQR